MLSSVFTFPVLCLLVLTAVHLSVSQLTDQQKQDLLDLHNRARSMVDPIATNMEEMVSWVQYQFFTIVGLAIIQLYMATLAGNIS